MLRFTGNNAGVRLVILALLILAVFGAVKCARAESTLSFGPVFIGSDHCAFEGMTLAREFLDRGVLAGIQTHGEGICRDELVEANVAAFAAMLFPVGRRFDIGFGAAVFEHGDIAIGDGRVTHQDPPRRAEGLQLAAVIMVRGYFLQDRLVLDFPFHSSTGGSTRHNPGLNMIQAGYRF